MFRRLSAALILSVVVASCGKPAVPVRLSFEVQFDGEPISCATADSGVALSDLRFYASNIHLLADDGQSVPIDLDNNRWQQKNLGFLDFEDNSGDCINGTAETNRSLHGTIPPGNYRGLYFSVGVPFELNHGDPLTAAAPLGDSAMHWHWRGGYKFLRTGVVASSDGYWIHVGSAGCEGTIGDISACRYPNRVIVALPEFEIDRDSVVIDLARLLADTDLADSTSTDCSSGPTEASCVAPFLALGIDHETGAVAGEQKVFLQKALP